MGKKSELWDVHTYIAILKKKSEFTELIVTV